jgi:hypothetical protein
MNIAYKLMNNRAVTEEELKHLLFLTLSELSWSTSEEIVGKFDEEECFNMDDMLDFLDEEVVYQEKENEF